MNMFSVPQVAAILGSHMREGLPGITPGSFPENVYKYYRRV